MEALAAITIPEILSFAYEALCFAWTQYENVEGNQAQCHLLLSRCGHLLLETCRHMEALSPHDKELFSQRMVGLLRKIDDACLAAKTTITRLANKSFLWRLLHQDKIKEELATAESTIADAFSSFNLGAHVSAQQLQVEISTAQAQDHSVLVAMLNTNQESDRKIISMLQESHRGRLRHEELQLAILKHLQVIAQSPMVTNPTELFIRTASSALQRVSGKPPREIPHWAVTSLEVTFDPDEEESCIGKGGFGNIYKGEWNGQIVAVKEMYSEDARMLDRNNLKYIRHEIMVWSRIAHPHVLPFYCACLEANRPFIVSRFCGNGNILEYLRIKPEADRITLLHEISLGMAYLHAQGIVHADLKGSNVLVGDDGKALIADFGLSRVQDQVSSAATRTRKMTGTLRWMAPELIEGEPIDKPADVYSFSLVAWELYTGEVPYGGIPDRAFIRRVVDKEERPPLPQSIDEGVWALMQQYWAHDPKQRPVFGTIQTQLRALLLKGRTPSATLSCTTSLSIDSVSRNPSQSSLSDVNSSSAISTEPPSALFDTLSVSDKTVTLEDLLPSKHIKNRSFGRTDARSNGASPTALPPISFSPIISESTNTVFIGGFPLYLMADQILELVQAYGTIKAFDFARDHNGYPKGFAYFEYVDPNVVDVAVKALDKMEIGGLFLTVQRDLSSNDAVNSGTMASSNTGRGAVSEPMPNWPIQRSRPLPSAPNIELGSPGSGQPPASYWSNGMNSGGWSDVLTSPGGPAVSNLPIQPPSSSLPDPESWASIDQLPAFDTFAKFKSPAFPFHHNGVQEPPILVRPKVGPKKPICHIRTEQLENVDPSDMLCVAIDDWWIAVGLASSEILVYGAVTGSFHTVLKGHKGGVWGVALGSWPDVRSEDRHDLTSVLLSGGSDRNVRVWDVESGHCLRVLQGHTATVRCIKLLLTHPQAVTAGRDRVLCVWAVRSGTIIHRLKGHMDAIRDIAVHRQMAATASYDSTCRVWDLVTGGCTQTLCGHTGRVYSVAFDGKRVASGGEDKTVRIWDAGTGTCQVVLTEHIAIVGLLRMSPKYLVSAGPDGMIVVYSFDKSTAHTIVAHDTSIVSLQLDPPNVISGSTDGSVKMFDIDTGVYKRHIGHPGEPSKCPWKFAGGRPRLNTWVVSRSVAGKAAVEIWTMR